MTESSKSSPAISENAWLAGIPVVSTYLAYIFQSSYLGYYGVPPSLIDIDIPKIVASMVAIAIAAVIFIALLAFVSDISRAKNPFIKIMGRWLLGVAIFLPFIIAGIQHFTSTQLITYSVIFSVLGLVNFLPPKQNSGENLSYIQRIARQEEEYREKIRNSHPKNAKQLIGDLVLAPFSALLFGTIYVAMLGNYFAASAETHRFLKSNPNHLYVSKNGESYIFAEIDRATKRLTGTISIVANSGDQPVELFTEKTGPISRPSK